MDISPIQRDDKLGEVQLLGDLNQQMVGVYEVPQAFAGELEGGGVPAAVVQRLENRHSSAMTDSSPTLTHEPREPALMLSPSTAPSL